MKEKKFPISELKKIIYLLEKNKINYYVFGGFALEAINKQEKDHEDLDLIIHKKSKDKLKKILLDQGYLKKTIGRLEKYQIESTNHIINIGILTMKEYQKFYKIKGNWVEDKISKKYFKKTNYLKTRNVKFKTMPFEWFSLYKETKHHNQKKQKEHLKTIKLILKNCKDKGILKQRKVKRLKSDPNYNKK